MKPEIFVDALAQINLPNVFNPYADRCSVHDEPHADRTRRANLLEFLRGALKLKVDTLWMGRDLGYNGGRRTGLALTDEYHLPVLRTVYDTPAVGRATRGAVAKERTASEIWSIIQGVKRPPFLWNVFPFHPFETGNPFTNRKFTAAELAAVNHLNHALIQGLGIRRIVAIGQDAASYSRDFGVEVVTVRHPSYGGTTEFRSGISALYPTYRSASIQAQMF